MIYIRLHNRIFKKKSVYGARELTVLLPNFPWGPLRTTKLRWRAMWKNTEGGFLYTPSMCNHARPIWGILASNTPIGEFFLIKSYVTIPVYILIYLYRRQLADVSIYFWRPRRVCFLKANFIWMPYGETADRPYRVAYLRKTRGCNSFPGCTRFSWFWPENTWALWVFLGQVYEILHSFWTLEVRPPRKKNTHFFF